MTKIIVGTKWGHVPTLVQQKETCVKSHKSLTSINTKKGSCTGGFRPRGGGTCPHLCPRFDLARVRSAE